MNQNMRIDPCLMDALRNLDSYITETTGTRPTQQELADALNKFFVLKEIREFIEMSRAETK